MVAAIAHRRPTADNFFARRWPLRKRAEPEDPIYTRRAEIAQRYIQGKGIELGALHSPLRVRAGVTVTYADLTGIDSLRDAYAAVGPIRSPDITTDVETMRGIADGSQDFVIANHVLEHVEDPLRALASITRVLRPSGIAFLAVPDKRFTFDKEREITPLAHLIRDHAEGPDWSFAAHCEEWCRCIDRLEGSAKAHKIALMTRQRSNIHFHVWDYPAMMELFGYVAGREEPGLDVEMSMLNGIEIVWVLRKRC